MPVGNQGILVKIGQLIASCLASETKGMHFLWIQAVLCYNKNTLMLIRIPVHREKPE